MHRPFLAPRPALPEGGAESNREGRDCALSQRITQVLLFPRLDGRPGGWLLLLAATCTYVAVRTLELASF